MGLKEGRETRVPGGIQTPDVQSVGSPVTDSAPLAEVWNCDLRAQLRPDGTKV